MSATAAALARWQNHPSRTRDEVARLLVEHGTPSPDVSRGMVVTGSRADVEAQFSGTVVLGPSSFTERDDVADAFACIDAQVPAGTVRVKMWVEGATSLPILASGDDTFAFEREWVVAGTFTGSTEFDADTDVVVVTLTPAA